MVFLNDKLFSVLRESFFKFLQIALSAGEQRGWDDWDEAGQPKPSVDFIMEKIQDLLIIIGKTPFLYLRGQGMHMILAEICETGVRILPAEFLNLFGQETGCFSVIQIVIDTFSIFRGESDILSFSGTKKGK